MPNITNSLLVTIFLVSQIAYFCTFLIEFYFFTRPVNRVDMNKLAQVKEVDYPYIVLFYPVLRELEETMRTTFVSLSNIDYPRDKYAVIAIPNADDAPTVASLNRLASEFDFLEVMPIPPTSDPSWQSVWDAWEANDKAYWFHRGPRAGVRDLPPKKTRQLIYAFYKTVEDRKDKGDFLINYIDADSAPPVDHFKAAAVGIRDYDVLQATNIAGNLLHSLPSSWFALDHLMWDFNKYGHLTADGKHPFWVLGKGLFFKASDLVALGGFHPWITIEDPEVGMRFWKNGKRLGLIENPLIEEVPETLENGITQRKRWVAGFFQSLDVPLKEMGFTRIERFKAWLNFIPCLSFWLNVVGIPAGIWAMVVWWKGISPVPYPVVVLVSLNILFFAITLICIYNVAWRRTKIVIPSIAGRLWYLLRINPLFLFIFWTIWLIPMWIGWRMYRKDTGLVWERTNKINANNDIVREIVEHTKVRSGVRPEPGLEQR